MGGNGGGQSWTPIQSTIAQWLHQTEDQRLSEARRVCGPLFVFGGRTTKDNPPDPKIEGVARIRRTIRALGSEADLQLRTEKPEATRGLTGGTSPPARGAPCAATKKVRGGRIREAPAPVSTELGVGSSDVMVHTDGRNVELGARTIVARTASGDTG